MDSSNIREQLKKQREMWMRQRELEKDKEGKNKFQINLKAFLIQKLKTMSGETNKANLNNNNKHNKNK